MAQRTITLGVGLRLPPRLTHCLSIVHLCIKQEAAVPRVSGILLSFQPSTGTPHAYYYAQLYSDSEEVPPLLVLYKYFSIESFPWTHSLIPIFIVLPTFYLCITNAGWIYHSMNMDIRGQPIGFSPSTMRAPGIK